MDQKVGWPSVGTGALQVQGRGNTFGDGKGLLTVAAA